MLFQLDCQWMAQHVSDYFGITLVPTLDRIGATGHLGYETCSLFITDNKRTGANQLGSVRGFLCDAPALAVRELTLLEPQV